MCINVSEELSASIFKAEETLEDRESRSFGNIVICLPCYTGAYQLSYPEDGNSKFLRISGTYLQIYLALHPILYIEDGECTAPYQRIAAMYMDWDYKFVKIWQCNKI
jgi:hypothetical protein